MTGAGGERDDAGRPEPPRNPPGAPSTRRPGDSTDAPSSGGGTGTWHPVEMPSAPPIPTLGAADVHLAAAEEAARRQDFATAQRERFRAVTRGLEQHGVLEVSRARTADETAHAATTALGERGEVTDPTELPSAARSFDEIVYGGRPATEFEYRRLEQADRYSTAPPPGAEPDEISERRRKPRKRTARSRRSVDTPELLRDWRFWAVILGVLAVALLIFGLVNALSAPSVPRPTAPDGPPPQPPDIDGPEFGEGQDSLFERLPGWVAFGGLQWAIAWVIVLWWRARRRGSVVPDPLPVQVPAHELLAGQAGLYRRSRDFEHVAARLRSASLRRLRPVLGLTADSTPDRVLAAVTARSGAAPALVTAALYDPVPDRGTLELVAAQLEWIEAEVL
ncbi:DUF4129 domain-containing protein [Nocardia otitidiscaviarum]|nr:DUF4129 domain-containing protein [Nocardia otitidiscaviarum]MCP9621926.1 DUF4129 domain-containing protein [Nocardia otitidiscaviarum]